MTIERQLLIGGEQLAAASAKCTEDRDPYTGELVATVSAAGPADAARAIDAAAAAFEPWAATAPIEKRKLVLAATDLLESHAKEAGELMTAELMTAETGAVGPWGMFNVFLATEMLREAAASV